MNRKNNNYFSFSINRTSVRRLFALTVMGILALFVFTSVLTAFEPEYSISSSSVNAWSAFVSSEALVHMIGTENPYFTQVLPESSKAPNISAIAFEMVTSINPEDPRSLLGRELPGFALFDGKIIVAGEGTNYTTMPIESAPPLEVMMAEREASQESLNRLDQESDGSQSPEVSTNGRKVVHIVHSHNRESFLPELKETDIAFHQTVNITLVGERLGRELEARGIGSDVDNSDIGKILSKRDWVYGQSYDASREIVKEAIKNNDDLEFFFDVHRDAQPRNITTVTINGVEYARTMFVIGENHSNSEKNEQFAAELHKMIDERYPGLSRGVITKGGTGSNGRYNQDLSKNSILIEIGGVDNTLEEAYRTAEAFAEVFSEFYWGDQKVNK